MELDDDGGVVLLDELHLEHGPGAEGRLDGGARHHCQRPPATEPSRRLRGWKLGASKGPSASPSPSSC